jgi:hypothetical protein
MHPIDSSHNGDHEALAMAIGAGPQRSGHTHLPTGRQSVAKHQARHAPKVKGRY